MELSLRLPSCIRYLQVAALLLAAGASLHAAPLAGPSDAWVESMARVHGTFKGNPGTFAQFGDSITVTLAFWAPLQGSPRNMSPEAAAAHDRVKSFMQAACWREWKGPDFGSNGSMTIRWALENVDRWLAKLNPEVALIMFGSNDVGQMDVAEYENKTRQVVERCLANGTVVLLSTMPPRSGHVEKSREFAEAIRRIAEDLKVPLVDYHAGILQRRPDDWDGSLPKFQGSAGSVYEVDTPLARDGVHPSNPAKYVNDFSEEGLRSNGFTLRNYLCLLGYAEVIDKVIEPER